MSMLEIPYVKEAEEGEPDVYLFDLKAIPVNALTCLIVDASDEIGKRHNIHATSVLIRMIAKYKEAVAAHAAHTN
jgi:hypothetical protein